MPPTTARIGVDGLFGYPNAKFGSSAISSGTGWGWIKPEKPFDACNVFRIRGCTSRTSLVYRYMYYSYSQVNELYCLRGLLSHAFRSRPCSTWGSFCRAFPSVSDGDTSTKWILMKRLGKDLKGELTCLSIKFIWLIHLAVCKARRWQSLGVVSGRANIIFGQKDVVLWRGSLMHLYLN